MHSPFLHAALLCTLLFTFVAASYSSCGSASTCTECTDDKAWVPGMECRWCPVDQACHQALSLMDPCSKPLTRSDMCPSPAPASPSGSTPPNSVVQADNAFAIKLVQAILSILKITDVDANTCVKDVADTKKAFDNFQQAGMGGNWTNAVSYLGIALSDLSTAINGCNLPEVQNKLDALAAALKWSKVSVMDNAINVLIDATNIGNDLYKLAKDFKTGNLDYASQDLNSILTSWTAITKGCASGSTACKFVDGLLKILRVSTADISACESALTPAVTQLEQGFSEFQSKNYSGAVADIASGLDVLSQAISQDSCGLGALASTLESVVPSLQHAIVDIESSEVVKITVGSAEVYDDLYQAAEDIANKDYSAFGMEMGQLLTKLEASGCSTHMCVVLTGLLETLELEANDFVQCSSELESAWNSLGDAISKFQEKDYTSAITDLGTFLVDLADGVKGCDASQLGSILEDVAGKLGDQSAVNFIGEVVQVLVEGADVTLDIQKLASDFNAKRWTTVGSDLGTLASWLQQTGCKSFVCKVLEGLLEEGAVVLSDLQQCEADLRSAESKFVNGAQYFHKKQFGAGLQSWSAGINDIANSVSDCGLEDQLQVIEQEANVFGFGNVTKLGDVVQILVHGADYYKEFYAVLEDFEAHNYKAAGGDLKTVLDSLSEWTSGHACNLDICYVTIGILEFIGDFSGGFKECSSDLKRTWGNFSAAYDDLVDKQHHGIDHVFHFSSDDDNVKNGIKDIGYGLKDMSAAVTDCHLQAFAELLGELAAKLGIVPEVSWLEEILKIVIDGVEIEKEIGSACVDYTNHNWAGFGYNIARLIKTLL